MKKQLTLALVLATTLTFTACEEKKKQDGAATKPPETASESQPSGGEDCPKGEPPQTVEAVFLENTEDGEGLAWSRFRLPSGKEIELNGEVPDAVKKDDKVSVTYENIYSYMAFADPPGCNLLARLKSVKKGEKVYVQD
jgi:hypothetical protein